MDKIYTRITVTELHNQSETNPYIFRDVADILRVSEPDLMRYLKEGRVYTKGYGRYVIKEHPSNAIR